MKQTEPIRVSLLSWIGAIWYCNKFRVTALLFALPSMLLENDWDNSSTFIGYNEQSAPSEGNLVANLSYLVGRESSYFMEGIWNSLYSSRSGELSLYKPRERINWACEKGSG